MACCQRNAGMDPGLYTALDSKYDQLCDIYPGTTFACVLTTSGEMLWKKPENGPKGSDRLIIAVASLKKASCTFAATLQQMDCNIIHVTGETHLLSCVDIDQNLLAFCTEMTREEISKFDTHSADAKLAEILTDVRMLLQGIIPLSVSSQT
mmetsp:Transcript_12501/g.15840  ORF Transcript_12501/g.15840 Transcript_12501/m.15840 type:complete len:151 (-) Transcript_12501:227-679(-)